MTETAPTLEPPGRDDPLPRHARITDARGRELRQLDPVALYHLHRPGPFEAAELKAIVTEIAEGIPKRLRVGMGLAVLYFVLLGTLLLALIIEAFVTGHLPTPLHPRNLAIVLLAVWPVILWSQSRRGRVRRTSAVLARWRRCAHCGYDLAGLAANPTDGATVCPECGAAWMLAAPETAAPAA